MSAHILIIEDDQGLRTMLTLLLEREGHRVDAAGGGAEALAKAAEHEYDLVVADIRMEGIDGLEALERVRASQPEARSLVITGYSTEADSIRAIRLGVGDYLKKPFDMRVFLDSVARLLAERRQSQQRLEDERRMRRSLLGAAETVARMLDQVNFPGRPEGGLMPLAQRAVALGSRVGLSEDSLLDVRLAALAASLEALGQPLAEQPLRLMRVLRYLEERWDGTGGPEGLRGPEIPLESRVVAVALAPSVRDPGAYDPQVVAALDEGVRPPAPEPPGRILRNLLNLGGVLLASGDRAGAEGAYRQILSGPAGPREAGEALLALAQLLPAAAAEHCLRAGEQAALLGPSQGAQLQLQAGLVLAASDPSGGWKLIEQAGRSARDVGDAATQARAVLAGHILCQAIALGDVVWQSLDVLLRPEHVEELTDSVAWLTPFLLEQASERGLAGLARVAPVHLGQRLLDPSQPLAGRVAAVRVMAQLGGPVWERLLSPLEADPAAEIRDAARAGRSPDSALPPPLRIHTLGSLEVFRGHERVEEKAWRSQITRHLLAFLAAHRGPVSEDVLLEAFWPDDLEKGRRSIYWCTSVLRGCLRPVGWPSELDYIVRSGGTLQLNRDLPCWHDLEELEAAAEQEDHRRVVSLYRAPFLESVYADWTEPIRDRVARRVQHALSILIETGRPREVLEYSHRLLELDPSSQEAYRAAVEAHTALGRPQEAIRLFESAQKLLAREYGLEPTIKLLEAYHRARLSLP